MCPDSIPAPNTRHNATMNSTLHSYRILLNPVRSVHNQRTLRRRHVDTTPTLVILKRGYVTKLLRSGEPRPQNECMIDSHSTIRIHPFDRRSERVRLTKVHAASFHRNGAIPRNHILAIQIRIRINLKDLGKRIQRQRTCWSTVRFTLPDRFQYAWLVMLTTVGTAFPEAVNVISKLLSLVREYTAHTFNRPGYPSSKSSDTLLKTTEIRSSVSSMDPVHIHYTSIYSST